MSALVVLAGTETHFPPTPYHHALVQPDSVSVALSCVMVSVPTVNVIAWGVAVALSDHAPSPVPFVAATRTAYVVPLVTAMSWELPDGLACWSVLQFGGLPSTAHCTL